MSELLKQFSIDDIQMYKQDENVDFSVVEIWALADHNNSHNNPISTEVLEKYADTFKGKFIVAEFDKWSKDVTTHTTKEGIIGYVDPNAEIEFKTKVVDDIEKEFVVVKGLLSKLYATDVVEMFRENNSRTVSCEFSCKLEYEEDENGTPLNMEGEPMYDTENPILEYNIHGITILGMKYNPSVKGTEIQIKQFVEKFAEENLVSHKMDKSKEAVDMGDWNGDKAKKDLVKEKNYETLAKSVCLLLEEGWEDRQITKLKYPVMNLKDDKWVYNAEGLSSALAYSAQHDQTVYNKVVKIQKKLGLYKDETDKEEKMAEKEFAIKIDDLGWKIYNVLREKYGEECEDGYKCAVYCIKGVYEEDNQKFAIICDKEDNLFRVDFSLDEENGLVLSEEMIKVEERFVPTEETKVFSMDEIADECKTFETKETEENKDIIMEEDEINTEVEKNAGCGKEMSDDKEKDVEVEKMAEEDIETEKKFSLDAYIDVAATLQMLEDETEHYRELADKYMKEMGADEILSTMLTLSKENDTLNEEIADLRKFKEERIAQDIKAKVDVILASVKEDIDDESYKSFAEKGRTLTIEQLSAFENEVKAFAYTHSKGKKTETNDGIFTFGAVRDELNVQKEETINDIYNRYS